MHVIVSHDRVEFWSKLCSLAFLLFFFFFKFSELIECL